ncbi:mitochondrial coenzyme A diphosphatase NUDT8-like [Scylla paramamosain]|uniref:mitochondrial coenzyme A diphosphatase NUDT8-like n=1 Tax=Scylla paramamosain TaxID=85552 RepID=UPI003082C805
MLRDRCRSEVQDGQDGVVRCAEAGSTPNAKQMWVSRSQAFGCIMPRVLQQMTGVTEVAGGWLGSMSRRVSHALGVEEARHSIQRRHRRALDLRNKMCQAAMWLAATPTRGMATASLSFETVLSEENKNSLKVRLAKTKSPRLRDLKGGKPRAAVLVPLCHVEGELSLLYTLRCLSLDAHAGEMCFPGGKVDPEDRDEVHTALREAHEEVGLVTGENVEVLGTLPPIPSRAEGTHVVGVLAYVGHLNPAAFTLSPGEVEAVIAASLKNLCHPVFVRQTQFRSTKFPPGYTLPVFLGTEPRVWGLTAILTHMTLTALLPGLYSHHLRHIPPLRA